MKTINNRWANRKGFTLAELMLAVAIIIILGALAFVGVANYLRGLRLLEMDNAAKEIFYAAQNRITAELNSGTLGRLNESEISTDKTAAGTRQMKDSKGNAVEYAVVYPDATPNKEALKTTLWDELLPFGSIDDTLRSGGSYIITYSYDKEANLATILDVWFASDEGTGMFRNWQNSESALLDPNNVGNLMSARGDDTTAKNLRRNFPGGTGDAVIGHYGRNPITVGNIYNFTNLTFKLVNDEVLYGDFTFQVKQSESSMAITDSILDTLEPQLKITITEDNGAKLTLRYDTKNDRLYRVDTGVEVSTKIVKKVTKDSNIKYLIVLDNITDKTSEIGQRFRDLVTTPDKESPAFKLGEDIRVNVEVYSNKVLANIDSVSAVDNSLFQYVKTDTDSGTAEAGIGKIRHLQNLSSAVSGVELGVKDDDHANRLGINSALQTADLFWDDNPTKDFVHFKLPNMDTVIGGNIYYNDGNNTNNSFLPIDLELENDESFEKQFGTVENADEKPVVRSFLYYDAGYTDGVNVSPKRHTIANLTVSGTDNAGLFGSVGTSTSAIPTENTDLKAYLLMVKNLDMIDAKITGNAAAGAVAANVQRAAMINGVNVLRAQVTIPEGKTGNAGGAVGQSVNGLDLWYVSVSESGITTETSGNAGGLLGEHSGSSVHLAINGCSVTNQSMEKTVTGTTAAGGLVGVITDGIPTITNSYSTAVVSGDKAGGLIGTITACESGSEIKSCYVGGHTVNGTAKYDTDPTHCNVQGTTVAGGFIGSIGTNAVGLTVNNSYTTASVSGDQAGGFIGSVGANTIVSNSYAVGLVQDTTPGTTPSGAFIGDVASGVQLDSSALAFNRYFALINGDMPAVAVEYDGLFLISSAEENLETYNNFVQLGNDNEFSPYDPMLTTMFGTKYFLPTVSELSGDASAPSTHVGDWQPVDTLVYNAAG